MSEERSFGALLLALITIGLLGVAFTTTWFSYEFSSGRTTPPGGPQPEEVTGVERRELEFGAQGWEGNMEPSDAALAEKATDTIRYGIYAAGGAMALVVLGEIPFIARIIRRRVSLGLMAVALLAVAATAALAWVWLPESMAGHLVEGPFTARHDEPAGYTRTMLQWGWYSTALAFPVIFGAGLFKFQAGDIDPHIIEKHRVSPSA